MLLKKFQGKFPFSKSKSKLKIPTKISCNQNITTILTHSFSSSESLEYPFKFNNQTIPNKSNMDVKIIAKAEILEGFKFIYTNLIEAMKDKDFEFIRNATEETLSSKLTNALMYYNKPVYINRTGNINIEVENLFMENHIGASSNRSENKMYNITGKLFKNPMSYISPMPDVYIYKNARRQIFTMRVIVDFKTNLFLTNANANSSDSDDINTQFHSLQLEHEFENPMNAMNLFDMKQSKKMAWLIPKSLTKNDKKEEFDNWVVTDIDGFMKGNPLV